MAFTPKTAPFSGKINAVTLGTGDKAIVIGGQNVMPFYHLRCCHRTRAQDRH